MIKILKASAGSGKTYTLAKEYIKLLLESEDPYAYRHILAVTFTNKATDEMKQRILKELDILASSPAESPYIDDLKTELGKSEAVLSSMSGRVLCNILNDYGAFSVSTIDKFFQRTLKAFSREIGQFASYQVELDKESLVKESVDRILDSLTEDKKELLDWLTDSVKDQLITKGKFSLDSDLYETAVALKSEEHRAAVEMYHVDESEVYSKEGLKALKDGCANVIDSFSDKVKAAAEAVNAVLKDAGVDADDFNRKFMSQIYKYSELERGKAVPVPTDSFMEKAPCPEKWFAKAKAVKLMPKVEGLLDGPLNAFCELFEDEYRIYRTAGILKRQVFALGLARELDEAFDNLVKEKNVMSLDDSNTILRGIIDGSDTPFIYEKIGVRFDHFLLDEFQDTSGIQWDNFHPLLADSDAAGNMNLIVGDVKQSIYRWRNSDWNLLNSILGRQFPHADEDSLKCNFRSVKSVVDFNNDFYRYAATCMDKLTGDNVVSDIYSDVKQEVKSKDKAVGNVDVIFCDKENGSQIDAVLAEIGRLRAAGASDSEIGILVRTNKIGADIASALLEAGIPVISDDSLTVKSSPAVRRLAALLSYSNNPGDRLNSFLAESLGIDPPSEYHSLVDLCEYFIREMKAVSPDALAGEIPYIQAFMDTVLDWSQTNGNSLPEFLAYWDDADPKISSPDDADAVRVMTVHKSKGLSFPYVIFPYTETVNLYKADEHWCRPAVEGTGLEESARGVYRVNLSAETDKSLFSDDYRRERLMQVVDAMNTYYVATTRAEKGMTIISAMPSDKCINAAAPGQDSVPDFDFGDMSQILYWYVHGCDSATGRGEVAFSPQKYDLPGERFRVGSEYKFSGCRKLSKGREVGDYQSFPLNEESEGDARMKARLEFSSEANDFFAPDGGVGYAASGRLRGIVMHDILSKVIVPEDLELALTESFESGSIDAEERDEIRSMLSARIASARERGWFPADRNCVFNETSIIDIDGEIYRPDRVVVEGDSVTVVDYKFGSPHPCYVRQISRYSSLYRQMGYASVKAALWYVPEDRVEEIS